MPYEVSFAKPLVIADRAHYMNDCCVGGDAVIGQLLPLIRIRYADIRTNQEDWGWFIWFRKGHVRLAVDIFTEDSEHGLFRIHLISRTQRLFLFDTVVDTSELEELCKLVESVLTDWGASAIQIIHSFGTRSNS